MSVDTFTTVVLVCGALFVVGMLIEIGSYFVSDKTMASGKGKTMAILRILLMVVPFVIIVIASSMTFK